MQKSDGLSAVNKIRSQAHYAYTSIRKSALFLGLACALAAPASALAEDVGLMKDYELKQVLIFSRHNVRTPLTWNSKSLTHATSKTWPKWANKGNQLTSKGTALEVYMGAYFGAWFEKAGLLPENACPDKDSVYIYTNRRQRTVATARAFATGAFPACDIAIRHQSLPDKDTWETMDPIFNYPITDKTPEFRDMTLAAMNKTYNAINAADLAASYRLLEEVVDYRNSPACKEDKQCSLVEGKTTFKAEVGNDPAISGPLKVANSIVDAMMMEYYEGFPEDQIVWGRVLTPDEWRILTLPRRSYDRVQFSSPAVARNLAKPLLNYIGDALTGPAEGRPRLTLLVGHDTNVSTLLSALEVQPYELPGQYEAFPIGSKIVFQRWQSKTGKQDFLKVDYVYQTTDQLRNARVLSLQNPPQHTTLTLKGCEADAQGLCAWSTFEKVLKEVR